MAKKSNILNEEISEISKFDRGVYLLSTNNNEIINYVSHTTNIEKYMEVLKPKKNEFGINVGTYYRLICFLIPKDKKDSIIEKFNSIKERKT